MARILITSGPTRQYLDPVRYLTNGSSGRMGAALAQAALDAGHEVTIVSGPVQIEYPAAAKQISVVSTEEMRDACCDVFPACDGAIGAAAPSDYRPQLVQTQKIAKTGRPLALELVETPDVIATLGAMKRPDQWLVGFALETHDRHIRAVGETRKEELRPDDPEWSRSDGFPKQRGRNHRSPRTPAEVPGGVQGASGQRHTSDHSKRVDSSHHTLTRSHGGSGNGDSAGYRRQRLHRAESRQRARPPLVSYPLPGSKHVPNGTSARSRSRDLRRRCESAGQPVRGGPGRGHRFSCRGNRRRFTSRAADASQRRRDVEHGACVRRASQAAGVGRGVVAGCSGTDRGRKCPAGIRSLDSRLRLRTQQAGR